MLVHAPADLPTAAEAVAFARAAASQGVGFALGPRFLTRAGIAGVAAVRAHGPVLADARLGGDPASVAAAARSLASAGATRITIGPGTGSETLHRVVAAIEPYGTIAVAVLVHPETPEADLEAVTVGLGRGRVVSRGASALPAGVEVLGALADLGVVTQVAEAGVVVTGVLDPETVATARERGAVAVVLAGGAGRDEVSSLLPFLAAATG